MACKCSGDSCSLLSPELIYRKFWMIRDGVSALYAREAYELGIGEDGESLNILAPTTVIRGRYDTLNLPTFDIDVTSPAEGVIRVRAGHWQGATDYPGFPLNADEPGGRGYVHATAEGNGDGEVGENGATVSLTTGGLTAKVVKGAPWNLTFLGEDGKVLTESTGKSLGCFNLNKLSNVTAQPVGEFGVTALPMTNRMCSPESNCISALARMCTASANDSARM